MSFMAQKWVLSRDLTQISESREALASLGGGGLLLCSDIFRGAGARHLVDPPDCH